MSQENIELVKRVIAAHERGDFEAVFAAYDPEIEWHQGNLDPAAGFEAVYRGHEGIRRFWRTWFEAWESVSFDYEEFHDAGELVVTILSQRMRGRATGLEFEWKSYGQVWTVRKGKISRVEFFSTRDEAMEAGGL